MEPSALPAGYSGIRSVVIDSSHHVLRTLSPALELDHREVRCFRVMRGTESPCRECPIRCYDPRLFVQEQPVTRFERVAPGHFEQISVCSLPHVSHFDRRFVCTRRPVSTAAGAALEELRQSSASLFFDQSRELLGNKVQALVLGLELLERDDLDLTQRHEVLQSLKDAALTLARFLSLPPGALAS